MTRKLYKKTGVVLLCIAMLMSFMPQMAFAESEEPQAGENQYLELSWNENDKAVEKKIKEIPSLVNEIDSTSTQWNGTDNDGWYVESDPGETKIEERVTVTGNVHVILKNGANLNCTKGINVSDGNSLTIYAQSENEDEMGSLTANGITHTAGIGGGSSENGGNITIHGGTVTATGGAYYGAGIGGGYKGEGGNITIYGGNVKATGGVYNGAGIGGGSGAGGGTTTIYGGTVKATGNVTQGGTGIGGSSSGNGGNITINGGTVNATGTGFNAGIGGGLKNGGTIIINGGTITAKGGENSIVDIGGGTDRWNNIEYLSDKIDIATGVNVLRDASNSAKKSEHVADDKWNNNAPNEHWQGCKVEDCTADHKTRKGPHSWGNESYTGESNTWTLSRTCDVCSMKQNLPLNGITVKTQPTTMEYTAGNSLALTGLVIEATYKENSVTETREVAYSSDTSQDMIFAIGETPLEGNTITLTKAHNGQKITVTYHGKTNETTALTVNAISLAAPTELQWEDTRAKWEEVEHASSYSVQLYNGTSPVGSSIAVTGKTEYSFTLSNFTTAGNYTFKVKAIGTGDYGESAEAQCSTNLNFYTVTWANETTTLKTAVVMKDQTPPAYDGDVPEKEADGQYIYEFSGWDKTINKIEADTTYNATFSKTHVVPQAGAGYTLSYTDETATAETDYEISTDNSNWSSSSLQITPGGNLYVRKAETTGNDPVNASASTTNQLPGRPEAPKALKGVNTTGSGKEDGKITGLAAGTAYQISSDNGTTWTEQTVDESGEITGLAAGTYWVRFPATNQVFASASVTVKISVTSSGGGYIPPTPEKPTVSQGDGYETEVDKDGNLEIKVDDDYEIQDVIVNGESKGPVTSLSGLKTGDKVEIIVISKEDKYNAYLKEGVEDTTIKAWSERTKKGIKVYFKKSYGFKVDGYEFFRTTKKGTFSKKPYYVSQKRTAKYLNNTKNLKKGTRYYYKIRGYRTIAGEKVYTQWSNIASRPAK